MLISLVVVVVALALLVTASVVRVPGGHRAVVTRRGREVRRLGPGTSFVSPFFTTVTSTDLRDRELVLTGEPLIGADDVVVLSDVTVRVQVTESASQPELHDRAVEQVALSVLRTSAGRIDGSTLLGSGDALAADLSRGLAAAGPDWGLDFPSVEVTTRAYDAESTPRREFRTAVTGS